jgi:ornithine cyclodeaminase/alanine dehydrogenase-like protein (mu-crystallin family)
MIDLQREYFVVKVNANFPGNFTQYGLPTIQGVIAVFDATDGRLLALMDSIEITILRTGAATAVAAKYLSVASSKVITICGCGNQGKISVMSIMKIRRIEKVFAFDINKEQAGGFAKQLSDELKIPVTAVDDLAQAVRQSDICITCTPSTKPFLGLQHTVPGIFIAAVGADSEHKQELCPDLVCSAKLVVDLKEQCATIGELHHALDGNFMKLDDVYADLGDIVAGKKTGRSSGDEIIIFDSTGTALQDAVAAAIVYERALKNGKGIKLNLRAENDREGQIQMKNQRDIDALSGFYPFR